MEGWIVKSRLLVAGVMTLMMMVPAAGAMAGPADAACWGQASKLFAQMGEMGEHSSSFETPRVGLRNLARSLYDLGAIEDDSMQALGAFVAQAEGLSIDACM